MLNYDGPKAVVGAREFGHYVSREHQQRNEDKDDPLLDHTQRPKDVGLPSTRLLNHCEMIGPHGMQ